MMKAWVYDPDRNSAEELHIYLEEREIPPPRDGYLLLKVDRVSVCGTDEMLFSGGLRRATPGIIPGHEFSGEIVEINSPASDFKVGQMVVGESHYQIPGSLEDGVIGLWPPKTASGQEPAPVQGAYAEFIRIPGECAHIIPQSLAQSEFWPSLFEPAGNDFLLAKYIVENVGAGRVGVFGCGPHGLYAQIFLRHFGVSTIVAFETDSYRVDFARELGCADHVLDPTSKDLQQQISDLTGGQEFDLTIDMVGKEGHAFAACCQLTREGGTVILFGLFKKEFEIEGQAANDLIFAKKEVEMATPQGRRLKVAGITGREGIWDDLIETVSSSQRLQRLLMKPVEVVGPLDLLGEEMQHRRPRVLKRAFSAFQ